MIKGSVAFASSVILAVSVAAQTRPALTKVRDTKIRLAYKGESALVDLDSTDNVTLGGERWHRYRLFFAAVKNDHVYFLFQEQGGSPLSNPMGPCGGDQPQTLIWLQTNFQMKVEKAQSEVFASCAYNGGRYQEGKARVVADRLRILFEEHGQKYQIDYDNNEPEKGFAVVRK